MKKSIRIFSILLLCAFLISSCRHDTDDVPKPKNPNENELITTLKLVFKEIGNPSNSAEALFRDVDGEGGMVPTIDTIRIRSGKSYAVEIFLLDETKTPASEISDEIEREGDSHQFFFSALNGVDISITHSDTDQNGVPIGLQSIWTANTLSATQNEKVKVLLKHQTNSKPVSGNGDRTIGSTDIEIDFPIRIE